MNPVKEWKALAYDQAKNKQELEGIWNKYFEVEKGIYARILEHPEEIVSGTLKELSERFNVTPLHMGGFIDGCNDSLVQSYTEEQLDGMDEETVVTLNFDYERLYKNMVGADATWLYGLEQWSGVLDEERRKALYKEQKESTTIHKPAKIYPNDPCPCGSGKKYKKCCGRAKEV